jgi:hypothetical protein
MDEGLLRPPSSAGPTVYLDYLSSSYIFPPNENNFKSFYRAVEKQEF